MPDWKWEHRGKHRRHPVGLAERWRLREAASGHQALSYLLSSLLPGARPPEITAMEFRIQFQDRSSVLGPASIKAVRGAVRHLRSNPGMRIVIGGFAGQPGPASDSLRLGLQRIAAIRAILLLEQVSPGRIGVGMRGAGWLVVERPLDGSSEGSGHGECRLVIHDSHWALSRN